MLVVNMVDIIHCQDGGFREFETKNCDVKIEDGYFVFNKTHIKIEDIKEIRITRKVLDGD